MGFLKPDTPTLPAVPSVAELTQAQQAANQFTQFTPYGNLLFGSVSDEGDFVQRPTEEALFIQETPFQSQRRAGEEALSRDLIGQAQTQFGNIYGAGSTVPTLDTATLPPSQFGVDFTAVPEQVSQISGVAAPQQQLALGGLPDRVTSVDVTPSYTSSIDTAGLATLPTDFAQFRSGIEQDIYSREFGLLNPEFQRQRETLEQNLANRGLPIGSAAYNEAVDRLERSQGEQLGRLAQSARIGAGQEASRQFGLQSTARGQQFGERTQQAALANQIGQQQLADAFSRAQLANQQRQAAFGEAAAAGQFGLGAQQQAFSQQGAQAALANAARQQAIAAQLLAADQANRARQTALTERQNIRGQQLAELSALLGGPGYQTGAFQMPGAVNVLGAQQLAQQNALAGYNAANQQAAAQRAGLFDLAAAGVSAALPFALGG